MYNFKKIEKKWQEKWEKQGLYKAGDFSKKPKKYFLVEFPYPSGDGLHVGHCRSYTALDILARKSRMDGFNVLYPMGWDAFGLPTENYAIKTGKHPREITRQNTDNFRRQMKSLGFSFDWSREINTTDPAYYKWTQWIFLQMWKKGLAYKAKMSINWCPSCKIGLANEEVIDGKCERCGTPVEKKEMEQWMLRITAYADKLLEGLKEVNYPERVKEQQINWIGRSEGAEINFRVLKETESPKTAKKKEETKIKYKELDIPVFTTRLDTIFGVSAIVLAPEHPLVASLVAPEYEKDVLKYITAVKKQTEVDRTSEESEKTGVPLGVAAINPYTGEEVPVWIGDYVLPNYGTGAVMMVPAHDTRDFSFAKKYGLPMRHVVMPSLVDTSNPPQQGKQDTFRKMVLAIVYNPKTEKYLTLKWKKQPWMSFITGGVEEGESGEEAARREIEEETGYTNVRLVKNLGKTEAFFFAAHKNVNRKTHGEHFLFELVDEKRKKISQEEEDKYDVQWLSPAELKETKMQHAEFDILWAKIGGGCDVYTDDGVLFNSGEFDGLTSADARQKMADFAEAKKIGRRQVNYHLRDWVFSRQHYWGEPIPLVFCEDCKKQAESSKFKVQSSKLAEGELFNPGWVAVPDDELPVKLPEVKSYEPSGTGESPLANIKEWVNVKCPKCGGKAKRETDTMPNWAGSSWYYLAYLMKTQEHKNIKTKILPNLPLKKGGVALSFPPFAKGGEGGFYWDYEAMKYWLPVDIYNGGMEHTTLHLLYSRFWHKFLYDEGLVPSSEPYKRRTSHGMVLGEGGIKMSKSKGNVINPDDVVKEYGADTLRVYEMFMGPFSEAIPWEPKSIIGVKRFLEKIWALNDKVQSSKFKSSSNDKILKLLHKTIKGVTEDIDNFKFNTAISKLMIFVNEAGSNPSLWKREVGPVPRSFSEVGRDFLQMLAPFAPHLAEELWEKSGNKKSVFLSDWPKYDPDLAKDDEFELVIQVNGKVRDKIMAPAGISENDATKLALASEKIKPWLAGKSPRKIIFTGKLVSIVI